MFQHTFEELNRLLGGFGKFPSGSNYSKCLPLEDE